MKGDRPPRTDGELLDCTTGTYWPKVDRDPEEALSWYIDEHLLVDELAWALHKKNIPDTTTRPPCDVLVLLVGYSLDPLFQSICVYDPAKKIVLVVNTLYGKQSGGGYGEALAERIKLLFKDARLGEGWLTHSPAIEVCELPNEEPDSVFRALHTALLRDQQADHKIIIDITGGKKNIDAGAFLFAAYTGAVVSYVNFELYDERKRRPFGYSCKIGPIERNPYDAFRLRDWEELRGHYENYRFTAARAVLKRIWRPMVRAFTTPPSLTRPRSGKLVVVRPEEVQLGLEKLDQALKFHEAWETGEYVAAHVLLPTVSELGTPAAVKSLGREWERIRRHSDVLAVPLPSGREYDAVIRQVALDYLPVYTSNELLFSYARDELARARRLLKFHGDYRSAFLRAAGLDEFLLKARVLRLWRAKGLDVFECFREPNREVLVTRLTDELHDQIEAGLASHDGGRSLRWSLSKDRHYDPFLGREASGFVPVDVGKGAYQRRFRLRPRLDSTPTLTYDNHCELSGEALVQLRNQASHAYLYLSEERAAQALELVEKNLAEFALPEWAGEAVPAWKPVDTQCVTWPQLARHCGLTFLPAIPTLVSS